jgi:hypothetical protein
MNVLRTATTVLLPLALSPVLGGSRSWEYPEHDSFFAQRVAALRAEYRYCTGDTSERERGELVEWKTTINEWAASAAFDSASRRFFAATGLRDNVKPCEIYVWEQHRKQRLAAQRRSNDSILTQRRRAVAESTRIARELARHPRSRCDFEDIPFGISRIAFAKYFPTKYPDKLVGEHGRLVAGGVGWHGRPCSAAFYFGALGALYQYEIQSRSYSGRGLDSRVRPIADEFAEYFEERLGKPDHVYRIGYFDIIQGRLSLYKVWSTEKFKVIVGLGTAKYRYYAKTIVIHKELAAQERARR